ncbi:hypothetical protein BS47DRAFT_1305101 [Hydnum rufescens UP504]|uniref:4-hydroxybenzoate polyprenyltransferase, mitochondrial n=1 Tax=Hydnum rufescens UP504 TaxID=1448309 RepID=A0A9P6DPQ9_9AGAM|nr:hypothetical protein BS47DRAFT_1305101 [Hydnum rufescens UP504]
MDLPSTPTIPPYALLTRIDKPIGALLLYYPCVWSILMGSHALALPPQETLSYIGLFGVGAFVMRSAGCTINDLWDRDLDKVVERTRERPLANGSITAPQAIIALTAQLSVGLAVLLQLNWYSIALGASSLAVVVIYPLMKRITYWPQFILGLAFNWGALLGWSAVAGAVDWSVCLPLYAGSICWTLVYDTIYAHQDKSDDGAAGIRSTALLFSSYSRPILTCFSTSSLGLITYAGYVNGQGMPFYVGIGASAIQMAHILHETDFDSRESCWAGFTRCGRMGLFISLGLTGDYLWTRFNQD